MSRRPRLVPMAAIAVALLLVVGAVAAADTVLHPFLAGQPEQVGDQRSDATVPK